MFSRITREISMGVNTHHQRQLFSYHTKPRLFNFLKINLTTLTQLMQSLFSQNQYLVTTIHYRLQKYLTTFVITKKWFLENIRLFGNVNTYFVQSRCQLDNPKILKKIYLRKSMIQLKALWRRYTKSYMVQQPYNIGVQIKLYNALSLLKNLNFTFL